MNSKTAKKLRKIARASYSENGRPTKETYKDLKTLLKRGDIKLA